MKITEKLAPMVKIELKKRIEGKSPDEIVDIMEGIYNLDHNVVDVSKLKLHQSICVNSDVSNISNRTMRISKFIVTRVHGGWIYKPFNLSSDEPAVFVPFPSSFNIDDAVKITFDGK